MRIGIDISQIQYRGTGVARYTQELLKHLTTVDTKNNYTLFYNSRHIRLQTLPISEYLKKQIHIHICEYEFPEKILNIIWGTFSVLPIEVFVGKQDIFFHSDWFTAPTTARAFTTVHDLAFRRYPETVQSYIRHTQEKRLARIISNNALHIFVDSFSTKEDMYTLYTIAKDRITVVYPGVTTQKQPEEVIQKTLTHFGLKKANFILTVGTIEPRKNLHRLFEAYKSIKTPVPLIVVGNDGWGVIDRFDNSIRAVGFISDEQLYSLYQSALFFIMPSLYEGFGFPAAEAMALGCPVCLSKTSSLIEVGGEAAHYCDPLSVDDIARALKRMLTDHTLRAECIKRGSKQVEKFTWEKAAKKILDEFNNLLSVSTT